MCVRVDCGGLGVGKVVNDVETVYEELLTTRTHCQRSQWLDWHDLDNKDIEGKYLFGLSLSWLLSADIIKSNILKILNSCEDSQRKFWTL